MRGLGILMMAFGGMVLYWSWRAPTGLAGSSWEHGGTPPPATPPSQLPPSPPLPGQSGLPDVFT